MACLECVCAVLRCEGVCREVQAEVYSLIKDWTLEEHNYLREHVPKMGLRTPFRDGTLQNVALKVSVIFHAPGSEPLFHETAMSP